MPFTMIHLHVAMRAAGSKTEKKEEFLLGSIAPDAVHYLPDYTSSYKCRSHLLPDGIPWGTCEGRNNELWEENIRKFVAQWAGVVEKDFILGYAVHLLTDLFNNVHVWTPLRSGGLVDTSQGMESVYHRESVRMNTYLTCQMTERDGFREALEKAEPLSIPGIIGSPEIVKMRQHDLAFMYESKEVPDIHMNQYCTLEKTEWLIREASDYAAGVLGL